ncbi:hypothetical protein [Naasia aerilata]|uniref:Uncharacterized protein n=1 Tax=Naasia aerilata TaxID=1162966 RepID=A0ABM8GGZ3_9MICO|nr:hypothetical protein [Naasia aerilata]BDZ47630.1 hypothetical protein GCM10025866_35390 [Naasia aerilata]
MMRRRGFLSAALLVTGLLGALVGRMPSPPAGAPADEGCPSAFPHRLTPTPSGSLYDRSLAAFLVCTDTHGTRTFLSNGTDAVWVVRAPKDIPMQRLGSSSLTASFLRYVDSPVPVLPAGVSVIVPRSPGTLELRIDPLLTVAQLAHDEIAGSLGDQEEGLLNAALEQRSGRARAALLRCTDAVIAHLGDPEPVLATGDPAPAIGAAASEVAATTSGCGAAWREAKTAAFVSSEQITSFAYDVARWEDDSTFRVRAVSASIAWWALVTPPGTPR